MPGENYPKDRVASTKYEKGEVQDSGKFKEVQGKEGYKPSRGSQDADDK